MRANYDYAELTRHCGDQIMRSVRQAGSEIGPEARRQREYAYGVYIGWRALVAKYGEAATFAVDDQRLIGLLALMNEPERLS